MLPVFVDLTVTTDKSIVTLNMAEVVSMQRTNNMTVIRTTMMTVNVDDEPAQIVKSYHVAVVNSLWDMSNHFKAMEEQYRGNQK